MDGVSLAMIDTFKIIGPSTQKMTFLWSIRNSIGHNFITSSLGWVVCVPAQIVSGSVVGYSGDGRRFVQFTIRFRDKADI